MKHNEHGFTLLEIILALSILAVLITTVYMSFSTAGKNVEEAEAIRDNTDMARTLIAKISADIQNAYCGNLASGKTVFYGKKREVQKEGETRRLDSLYMTTLTNWRKPDSKETELNEVGYFFKEKLNDDRFTLMRHEKRELKNEVPPLEGGNEYELTGQVRELRFRYLQRTMMVDEIGSSSPCTKLMAKAVEISLTLENGEHYTTLVEVGNAPRQ
ncbi:MAG: type II secretion system protein [Nitrospirota bacterium]